MRVTLERLASPRARHRLAPLAPLAFRFARFAFSAARHAARPSSASPDVGSTNLFFPFSWNHPRNAPASARIVPEPPPFPPFSPPLNCSPYAMKIFSPSRYSPRTSSLAGTKCGSLERHAGVSRAVSLGRRDIGPERPAADEGGSSLREDPGGAG